MRGAHALARVIRPVFLAWIGAAVGLASCGGSAYAAELAKPDHQVQEKLVTQVLLLNAVRGAERVQSALADSGPEPCKRGKQGPAPAAREQALLFPQSGGAFHVLVGGYGLPGGMSARGQKTYAYEVSYEKPVARAGHAAGDDDARDSMTIGVVYLNEGHIQDSHRDEFAAQLWKRWTTLGGKLKLGAGVGPGLYFDTIPADNTEGYKDAHGLGALASVSAQMNLGHGVHLEGRANQSLNISDFDSRTLLMGVSLRASGRSSDGDRAAGSKGELRALAGARIVNSYESDTDLAYRVEYWRPLHAAFGATVSYLNEGDQDALARQGVAIQAALTTQNLANGKVELGAAVGPYFNRNRASSDSSVKSGVAGIVTLSAGFRLTRHTGVHVSDNRVVTGNNRDADVLLIGLFHAL